MVNDEDLIAWLRNEKFDAALASMYDMCAQGLFHVANIKPVMGFLATPAASTIFSMFGISTPSSYTQGVSYTDRIIGTQYKLPVENFRVYFQIS